MDFYCGHNFNALGKKVFLSLVSERNDGYSVIRHEKLDTIMKRLLHFYSRSFDNFKFL